MVEYRPVHEEGRETFHEYASYAFHPEDGPPESDPEVASELANLGAIRVPYADGRRPAVRL